MRFKVFLAILLCFILLGCSAYHWKSFQPNKRREKYIQEHPDLTHLVKQAILRGDVILGMTTSEVIASRGQPWKVNRTTGEFGIHEQWVMFAYEYIGTRKDQQYGYIYFENGKVTSWQSR